MNKISSVCHSIPYFNDFKSNISRLVSHFFHFLAKINRIAFPTLSQPFFAEIATLDKDAFCYRLPVQTKDAQSSDALSELPSDVHDEILGWLPPKDLVTAALVCKVWLARQRKHLTFNITHQIKNIFSQYMNGDLSTDLPLTSTNAKIMIEKLYFFGRKYNSDNIEKKIDERLEKHLQRYLDDSIDYDPDNILSAVCALQEINSEFNSSIRKILRENIFEKYFYRENENRSFFHINLNFFMNVWDESVQSFFAKECSAWIDDRCQNNEMELKGLTISSLRAINLQPLNKKITFVLISKPIQSHELENLCGFIQDNPHLKMLRLNLSELSRPSFPFLNRMEQVLVNSSIEDWRIIFGYRDNQPVVLTKAEFEATGVFWKIG